MLVTDPDMRIKIKDIKKHKFFYVRYLLIIKQGIDWNKAQNRQLEPFYIPEVISKFDSSYFKPKVSESYNLNPPLMEDKQTLLSELFLTEAENYILSQNKKPLGDFGSHIINNNLLEYF